jgi:electron transport complex protein RnfG
MTSEANPSVANDSEVRAPVAPMPSPVALVRTLGLIAMIAGLLVVLAYQITDPIIKEKELLALEEAVYRVIPGVDEKTATRISYALSTAGLKRLDDESAADANLFAVYGASGKLVGLAMQGAAQGYSDVVRTLFSYDPKCQCINGLTVLKTTDTPGFGDKKTVEGKTDFIANFKDLSVKVTADKKAIAHPIETVKHGTKTAPWQVDAMSGATFSSRGIGNGLRAATDKLVPLIQQHLSELESMPKTEVSN